MVKVSVIAWFCVLTNALVCGKPHWNATAAEPSAIEILRAIPEGRSPSTKVNFSYNEIDDLPDYVFVNTNHAEAESVDLVQNKIARVGEFAFWGLERLKVIDLSDNLISSLPEEAFRTNRKLHRLVLTNNRISFEEGRKFLVSETVETLVLSNNKIEEIHDSTFEGLPKLKRLLLTDNPLRTVSEGAFRSSTNLRYLSLANTGVRRLTEGMFAKLPHSVNLEDTSIARQWNPPLTIVRGHAVRHLVQLDAISGRLIYPHHHHNKTEIKTDDFD